MHSVQCEAIVLGAMDYRESDRIVTLFTLEQGKVRGIARGAKTSRRRFGPSLELFAHLRVEIVVKEGLSSIHQADILTLFPSIREDLNSIGHAAYACELVDAMLPEGMANPRLFRLTTAYLERLDSAPAKVSERRFFEMNLLNIMGYRPALDHCASCADPLTSGGWRRTSSAADGLLCSQCGRGGALVSMDAIRFLTNALKTCRFPEGVIAPATLEEAGRLLDLAIGSHLNRPLKSLSFLREIVS